MSTPPDTLTPEQRRIALEQLAEDLALEAIITQALTEALTQAQRKH